MMSTTEALFLNNNGTHKACDRFPMLTTRLRKMNQRNEFELEILDFLLLLPEQITEQRLLISTTGFSGEGIVSWLQTLLPPGLDFHFVAGLLADYHKGLYSFILHLIINNLSFYIVKYRDCQDGYCPWFRSRHRPGGCAHAEKLLLLVLLLGKWINPSTHVWKVRKDIGKWCKILKLRPLQRLLPTSSFLSVHAWRLSSSRSRWISSVLQWAAWLHAWKLSGFRHFPAI